MNVINAITKMNPIAVIIALLVHYVIGFIWYHPLVFGTIWREIRGGIPELELKWVIISLITHVIAIFTLAIFIKLINVQKPAEGLIIGIMISVGLIGTVLSNDLIFGKVPLSLFFIKLGDEVLSICASCIVLTLWI